MYNILNMKQNLLLLFALCGISYAHAQDNKNGLIINEIMQSNVECIMDDIHEFPDSWVELYNNSDQAVNLKDYQISNKNKVKKAWQLPNKTVGPKEYVLIYCDKEGLENKRLHADFRLESGKGCTVYLFKDKNAEPVDSLPYIDDKPLAKMPAPDVAFGRKTDGADEWGYQLTPTPGKANTGETYNNKHILGAPEFSEKGRVTSDNKAVKLELSLPKDAPEGAYIVYTKDGSEPTTASTKYTAPINITKTMVIRAKVFCDGWLSPFSTAQSYIFHPRKMTLPIFSMQINNKYLNGGDSIGLFKYNNEKKDKKNCDWRRPMNVEFFPVEGEASAFNQLGELRIQGGQSRSNALKSLVFYANKRFDPDHKRFQYEFFPDQKPGITEFKSFSLRDGGNDFGDLYFRDLIIQRTMASHVDLDWQAGHSAVLYINGEYMGMLNIRERSNEDNIYSNYDGLEELDMVEISHEKDEKTNKDLFIEEYKEGDSLFYKGFKEFYSQKGHTLDEYEQWIDVSEYLNVMVMNLFYGNLDFPGNNFVLWRPNDDAKDCPLPKRFRVIVKDTDFGLGLYNRSNDVNALGMIYNPSINQDNWAFTEPATRLFKNMMENEDMRQLFIDKSCVYMGDFMNAEGTGEIMDSIKEEALEEFVAHRDKYNSWGNNRTEILNKFQKAKEWLAGWVEENQWGGWGGWWGGGGGKTIHQSRMYHYYAQLSKQYQLGDTILVTVNKNVNDLPDSVTINGIKLSQGVFDGKLFPNRMYTISAKAPEGKAIKGWKVITTPASGSKQTKEYEGSEFALNLATCKSVAIEAILGEETGISSATQILWQWKRTVGGVNVSNVPAGEKVSIYDLRGVLLSEAISNGSDIFLPAASGKLYILKVGSESVKIQ